MLITNLKSIATVGNATEGSYLSATKHTTTNYTYKKLKITQATVK
jgi:hypothetical protein